MGAFSLALDTGHAQGHVTEDVVRATFSALEKVTPDLSIDLVENPFKEPHNLSWYFGCCACPQDVRTFATFLRKGHLRVWSVAQDLDGWKILVQVFGSKSANAALEDIAVSLPTPAAYLKHFALAQVVPYQSTEKFKNYFAEQTHPNKLQEAGFGHLVEVFLLRRY